MEPAGIVLQINEVDLVHPPKYSGSDLLFLYDFKTNSIFLIDSGSERCFEKVSPDELGKPTVTFRCPNQSRLYGYGASNLSLTFGSYYTYTFSFEKANVPYHIIGADFIRHFGWILDMKHRTILDEERDATLTAAPA